MLKPPATTGVVHLTGLKAQSGLRAVVALVFIVSFSLSYAQTEPPAAPPERVYLWQSPAGKPILSGTLPPWYRNELYPTQQYPPILVYEAGVLLDDTRNTKPYIEVQQLREAALAHQQQLRDYEKWLNRSYAQQRREALEQRLQADSMAIGMSVKQVESLWGVPQKSLVGLDIEEQPYETWFYNDGRQVRFVDGQVAQFTAILGDETLE